MENGKGTAAMTVGEKQVHTVFQVQSGLLEEELRNLSQIIDGLEERLAPARVSLSPVATPDDETDEPLSPLCLQVREWHRGIVHNTNRIAKLIGELQI